MLSFSMDDDWDLHAVVRGCCTTASYSSSTTSFVRPDFCFSSSSSFASERPAGSLFCFPDPFETRNAAGELHELYKPFFPKSHQNIRSPQPQAAPISPLSSLSVSKELTQIKQPKQSHAASVTSTANSHTPRSKRRKNQLKKICQVPAESLSLDVWAWRKYGQKPIKGSPYPRSYYRCSSSKGCLARKQVERNRSDPGIFIVSYTGEHNHPAPTHRNSLAGSTRQKVVTSTDSSKSSPPAKPTRSSSATSLDDEHLPRISNAESREEKDTMEYEEEEEEEFGGFSDMTVVDDLFSGLEELADPVIGDRFSDHFPVNFGIPWLANNAATAAEGV